jgi:UDP-GlcNAc3NAcA epimerase
LFCPTDVAVSNLVKEGFENFPCQLVKNGDVMQDAALYYAQFSEEKSTIIEVNKLTNQSFILCTIHRAENTDDKARLESLFAALDEINKDTPVVLPLHPRTKKMLETFDIKTAIKLIDPVGYFDMIELLKNTKLVMTDSGGLQKEAFFFKNPCITLRDETEWIELVENGYNRLVGADKALIIQAFKELSTFNHDYDIDLYGNGQASERIARTLLT